MFSIKFLHYAIQHGKSLNSFIHICSIRVQEQTSIYTYTWMRVCDDRDAISLLTVFMLDGFGETNGSITGSRRPLYTSALRKGAGPYSATQGRSVSRPVTQRIGSYYRYVYLMVTSHRKAIKREDLNCSNTNTNASIKQ